MFLECAALGISAALISESEKAARLETAYQGQVSARHTQRRKEMPLCRYLNGAKQNTFNFFFTTTPFEDKHVGTIDGGVSFFFITNGRG